MPSDANEARLSSPSSFRLLSSAIGTSGLLAVYTLLLLLTTILLARWLGPEQYGVYALVIAIVVIVGHFATPGTENLLIRDVASYGVIGEHGKSRGLLVASTRVALIVSAVLILTVPAITYITHSYRFDAATQAMLIGCLIIPIAALSRVRTATLVGLHRVVLARIPELIVRPITLLVLVAVAIWVSAHDTAVVALALTCIAYLAAFAVGTVMLWRMMPTPMRAEPRAYDYPRWLRASPSFLATGFSDVLSSQLSITLIGWLGTPRDAGVFAVANRGAGLVALGFVGVAAVAAPRIAHLWSRQELRALDELLRNCTLLSGGVAALGVAIVVVFRDQLLAIFGPGFVSGDTALVILSVGQLAFATVGIRATALLMTGAERQAAFTMIFSLVLTTVLSAVLIPRMGQDGAALAWTASICMAQVLTIVLWRRHRRSSAHPVPSTK